MSPAFVARCPHGHTTDLDTGAWAWCPQCPHESQRTELTLCDLCGGTFTPSQWELRHRPHLADCPGCGDHYGVCVCPPADVHDRCCGGCANHQEEMFP